MKSPSIPRASLQERRNSFLSLAGSNCRWKWMAASSAAFGAASTGVAVALPAQITLSGNQASLLTNTINADITGDGIADLPNLNVFQRLSSLSSFYRSGYFYYRGFNRIAVNSGTGSAAANSFRGKRFGIASFFIAFRSNSARTSRISSNSPNVYYAYAGSGSTRNGSTPQSATALVPVTFSDRRINSGAPTTGFLQVRAFNAGTLVGHAVQFLSLAYEDVNATLLISLRAKLKKLKKNFKKAKSSGKKAKANKLKKKIKKIKKQIKALQ